MFANGCSTTNEFKDKTPQLMMFGSFGLAWMVVLTYVGGYLNPAVTVGTYSSYYKGTFIRLHYPP